MVKLLFAPIWFYLPLFGYKIPFMSIFIPTYLHLPLFTYIWPNVALITLIWSYFFLKCTDVTICAIFTLYRYSSMETAPMYNYSWRYCISKNLGIQKVWLRLQFGCLCSQWQLIVCKAIEQFHMEILNLKDLGHTESVVTNAVVLF